MDSELDIDWKWKRRKNGWVAGVFEGLGASFGVNPLVLRIFLLLSVLLYGSGIIIYLVLAIIMPMEDAVENYDRPHLLGVCYRVSNNTRIELPVIRLGMTIGALISFGLFIFIYFALAFGFYYNRED